AEWRMFGALYRSDAILATSWWALIAIRGLLPAAFALVMGVLVERVQGGGAIGWPLAAAGVLFMALQTLGPVHSAVSSTLGQRVSGWLHERLLDACDGPRGLAHLEDPDLARD